MVWEIWLYRKPTKGEGKNQKSLDFAEYKELVKKNSKIRKNKKKVASAEQESEQINFASKFIKARKDINNGDGRSI